MRKLYLSLMALVAFMGLAFAINPAENWTIISQSGWTAGADNASVVTQGGNVTNLDLNSNVSTTKWAGYYGDVTGDIILSPSTYSLFYKWAWTPAGGGKVCAVAAPSGFAWTAVTTATDGNVDSVWGFDTGATDSATNTLNDTCDITIGGINVTATAGTTTGHGAGDTFKTCAVSDGATALKSDLAFCTNIQDAGTVFDGTAHDYELLAPTNQTVGQTETHYFWMELD